jgi:hypothetical protein
MLLPGCEFNVPILVENMPEVNGYDLKFRYPSKEIERLELVVGEFAEGNFQKCFRAEDLNGDNRADYIWLLMIDKGDPLERMVSIEKLERIFKTLREKYPPKEN